MTKLEAAAGSTDNRKHLEKPLCHDLRSITKPPGTAVFQLVWAESTAAKWLFPAAGSPATGLRRWGGVRGPHGQAFVRGVDEKATFLNEIDFSLIGKLLQADAAGSGGLA